MIGMKMRDRDRIERFELCRCLAEAHEYTAAGINKQARLTVHPKYVT